MIAIVCGLTWIATAGERFLPILVLDSAGGGRGALIVVVAVVLVLLSAVALTLLWIRLVACLIYGSWFIPHAGTRSCVEHAP